MQRFREKKANPNLKKDYQRKGESLEVFNLNRPKLRARIRTDTTSSKQKQKGVRRHTEYNNEVFSSKGD